MASGLPDDGALTSAEAALLDFKRLLVLSPRVWWSRNGKKS
jgi:hypothetical protein